MNAEYTKDIIMSLMPHSKKEAMKMTRMADILGISTWELKELISELREDYPIVSRTKEGGGYWLAQSEQEIHDFITEMTARRDSYNKTIAIMTEHLEG